MTKVNREVEERIKESFKKGYIKGVLDKEWGQTTAEEKLEEVREGERKRCLDRIKKEVGIELSFVSQIAGHDNLTQMDMLSKSIAYLRVRDIIQSIFAISNKKDND